MQTKSIFCLFSYCFGSVCSVFSNENQTKQDILFAILSRRLCTGSALFGGRGRGREPLLLCAYRREKRGNVVPPKGGGDFIRQRAAGGPRRAAGRAWAAASSAWVVCGVWCAWPPPSPVPVRLAGAASLPRCRGRLRRGRRAPAYRNGRGSMVPPTAGI